MRLLQRGLTEGVVPKGLRTLSQNFAYAPQKENESTVSELMRSINSQATRIAAEDSEHQPSLTMKLGAEQRRGSVLQEDLLDALSQD